MGLHARSVKFAMSNLADIYEDHAEDCILTAAQTDDRTRRDLLLHLAIKWRESAEALRREPLQWSLVSSRTFQIYEDHAEDCIHTAANANDAKRRDVLLDLAAKWRERASALRRNRPAD
jgi:DNA-binding FrmR family transcriptional regulator